MLCNLQIFSGCVCHLEQLHAQSPFLFPIVFSINLIPFFNNCRVNNLNCSVLAVLSPRLFGYVLLYLGRCSFATVAVWGFGSWSLAFHCGMPRQITPLPRTPSQTEVCSTMGESIRPSSLHNPMPSAKKHVVQICRFLLSAAMQTVYERRTSPFNGIERSLSRPVVIKTKSLPISETTFPTALSCTSRTMGDNPTLSANKHVVQICRSSLSAAADGLADGSGERPTSLVNGIERSLALSRVIQ